MWMVAQIDYIERVRFLKEFIQKRSENNYMFIPTSSFIDIINENNDVTDLGRRLLDSKWGSWLPKDNETLSQKITHKNGNYNYQILLTMDDAGFRSVYIQYTSDLRIGYNFVYGTTAYHNLACDEGKERYNYQYTMYKYSEPDSKWSTTQT